MKRWGNNRELEELKQELELSEVPAIVDQRLQQTYVMLPDRLPERGKVPGRMAKRISWCCASLLAAVGLLFGVNALNPAFAESIPGLGSLFALMNDHSMHPMGGNLGTYGEQVQKLGVEIPDKKGSGYGLTADEAFCDGEYLYLTLRLSCPQEAERYESVGFSCEGKSDQHVLVDGQELQAVSGGGDSLKGDRAMVLVRKLPRKVENGTQLEVSLQVGELWGIYPNYKTERKADRMETDFSASFVVTADTSKNSAQALEAEDNQVVLYGVERTPGYMIFDLEIPYWGRESDAVLGGGPCLGYAMLFTEDGQELRHNSDLMSFDLANAENKERIRGTWAFDGPGEGEKKVILRIMERIPSSTPLGTTREKPYVFAEFTINLEDNTAEPSATYVDEGYETIDTAEYQSMAKHAGFVGGYFVQDICHTQDMWHDTEDNVCAVQLLADTPSETGVEVRFYSEGELVGTVKARSTEEYNDQLGGGFGAFLDENGFFTSIPAEEETGGEARYSQLFAFFIPKDWEQDGIPQRTIDRVDLVNSETGEVLMENIQIGDGYQG